MIRYGTTALAALTLSAAAWADTTIYGEANVTTYVLNNDPGTSLQIYGGWSHFGFRGSEAMTEDLDAEFDARFYANVVEEGFPQALKGNVGVSGDFGVVQVFGGKSPVTRTDSYLNLMQQDPTSTNLILGDGLLSVVAGGNSQLPAGYGLNGETGLNFTSTEIDGGLSFDAAILPAQNPDGDTGFSLAATLAQDAFSVSGGFEVNGAAPDTQLFRVVGEYYLDDIAIGGLVQNATNNQGNQNLSGFSVLGFAKLPVDITDWPTRLKLLGGIASQEDSDNNIEESQTYLSAVHEIQFADKVSSYSFGEIFLANDSAGNVSRFGGGLRIRF